TFPRMPPRRMKKGRELRPQAGSKPGFYDIGTPWQCALQQRAADESCEGWTGSYVFLVPALGDNGRGPEASSVPVRSANQISDLAGNMLLSGGCCPQAAVSMGNRYENNRGPPLRPSKGRSVRRAPPRRVNGSGLREGNSGQRTSLDVFDRHVPQLRHLQEPA